MIRLRSTADQHKPPIKQSLSRTNDLIIPSDQSSPTDTSKGKAEDDHDQKLEGRLSNLSFLHLPPREPDRSPQLHYAGIMNDLGKPKKNLFS